jgi:hypothetical protein
MFAFERAAGRRSRIEKIDCEVRQHRRPFLEGDNCMKPNCRVSLVLGLAALVLILASSSESSTASRNSKPTFAPYQDNPYQYLYGNVINAKVFRHEGQPLTNVEFKPVQTYPMFSQFVTFCGNQEDKFDFAASEPVVLVYSRIMHRRDCFDLLRVDVVQGVRQVGQARP